MEQSILLQLTKRLFCLIHRSASTPSPLVREEIRVYSTFSGFNLETAVSQTITVTDGSMSATTNIIIVNAAAPTSIQYYSQNSNSSLRFKSVIYSYCQRLFLQPWDVTALTTWNITAGAGGSWSRNVLYFRPSRRLDCDMHLFKLM